MRVLSRSTLALACGTALFGSLSSGVRAQVTALPPAPPATQAPSQPAPTPASVKASMLIPRFVADVRYGLALLGQSTITATSLNVDPLDIPAHSFTPVIGAHVYFLRRPGFALGIGGEFVHLHALNQPVDATTGKPRGPAIERTFASASPQISMNFGRKLGWSYLSGGLGPVTFDTYLGGTTPDGLHPATLNYGGGGRWFSSQHVAFAIDLRFYTTKPALATAVVGERNRQRVTIFSMGVAIK